MSLLLLLLTGKPSVEPRSIYCHNRTKTRQSNCAVARTNSIVDVHSADAAIVFARILSYEMRIDSLLSFTRVAALLVLCAGAGVSGAQQLAFTWDDLPAHAALPAGETRAEIMQRLIDAMKAEKMPPVYGFVNGVRIQQEPASAEALAEWQRAGFPVGNHTWSHMNLNEHTAAEWEADFDRNEATLAKYSGHGDTSWLRYPYLAEGDSAAKRDEVRAFLVKRGYRIAGVTMSFGDYAYNDPYARCVAMKDTAAITELETAYLAAADAEITYRRALAKAVFGHDIPYVLLMHVGALDARVLPRLLKLYRERGFTFVTLEQAEADPFYANDLDPALSADPDTLEAAAKRRKVAIPSRAAGRLDLAKVCRSPRG